MLDINTQNIMNDTVQNNQAQKFVGDTEFTQILRNENT